MRRHPWVLLMFYASFLAWDYGTHPDLVMFLLYIRAEGESYDWTRPRFPVMVEDGRMVLQQDCLRLPLWGTGPWYAVARAISRYGIESPPSSQPSNEVQFWWSYTNGCQLEPPADALRPPTPHSPPVASGTSPWPQGVPPLQMPKPTALPKPPVGECPWITCTPQWNGTP